MNIERRVRPFEIKAMSDGGTDGVICTFTGLAGVFLNLDWKGDIFDPSAFDLDLKSTIADGVIRDEHMTTTGRIDDASITAPGLVVKGAILDTTAGRDQSALVKGNAVKKLSVGVQVLGRTYLESPDAVKAYWATKGYTPTEDDLVSLGYFGGARVITRAKVPEVSTTWLPVNDKARITEAKGGQRVSGHSFADHSNQVLATVGEFLERAEKVQAMRSADGRSLSPEAKSRLTTLKARLDTLLSSLETKAAIVETKAPTADALYAEFLATCARQDGLID